MTTVRSLLTNQSLGDSIMLAVRSTSTGLQSSPVHSQRNVHTENSGVPQLFGSRKQSCGVPWGSPAQTSRTPSKETALPVTPVLPWVVLHAAQV